MKPLNPLLTRMHFGQNTKYVRAQKCLGQLWMLVYKVTVLLIWARTIGGQLTTPNQASNVKCGQANIHIYLNLTPPFILTSLRTTAGTQTTTQKVHGATHETQQWNGKSAPFQYVVKKGQQLSSLHGSNHQPQGSLVNQRKECFIQGRFQSLYLGLGACHGPQRRPKHCSKTKPLTQK